MDNENYNANQEQNYSGYTNQEQNYSGYTNQEQNYSGIDNYYNQNEQYSNSLGEVPEPDKRPGCLTSLLGFILTIVLMVSLTVFLIIFTAKTSLYSAVDAFSDAASDFLYDELANDTELEEALELLDCEFSDIISEDTAQKIVDTTLDAIVKGEAYEPNDFEVDYGAIADGMYDVSEKAVDKALDAYIDFYKTGKPSEELELLDSFLIDVVGYDLESEFISVVDSYGTDHITAEVLEQAKKDTMAVALSDVRETIDNAVYTELKPDLDESLSELEQDEDMRDIMRYFNLIPAMMYGALITCVAIILIQFLMYRQKYRVIRNISVVCFFNGALFSLFSFILKLAREYILTDSEEEYKEFAISGIDGLSAPFFIVTAILIVTFVATFIISIVMKQSGKRKYNY